MRRAPAAERNKEPILEKLKEILPASASYILEIASGTGQHVAHFAKSFKGVTWQPTEYDTSSIPSIQAFINQEKLDNVRPPLVLDVTKPVDEWPKEIPRNGSLDGIYCANMIHISPWACSVGLFRSAGILLNSNGLLITYGPYAVDGVLTPESNVQFNQGLRNQNPEWGVRDVKDLIQLAEANHLKFEHLYEMPANNKILIFKKVESRV